MRPFPIISAGLICLTSACAGWWATEAYRAGGWKVLVATLFFGFAISGMTASILTIINWIRDNKEVNNGQDDTNREVPKRDPGVLPVERGRPPSV